MRTLCHPSVTASTEFRSFLKSHITSPVLYLCSVACNTTSIICLTTKACLIAFFEGVSPSKSLVFICVWDTLHDVVLRKFASPLSQTLHEDKCLSQCLQEKLLTVNDTGKVYIFHLKELSLISYTVVLNCVSLEQTVHCG